MDLTARNHHDLERPDGPPGAQSDKVGVGDDDTVRFAELEVGVVAEETAAVGPFVGFHVCYFERGFFWDAGGGPDLAVWVGVGAAHC